nr:MAG TPA: Nigerythrin, Rubredoxin, Hemerythrin, Peroxidase, Electron.6A [Caudoviricetes sp.]
MLMKRIYDKQPREHHRKRSHYNSRGVAKLSFDNEKVAARYIKKKRLLGYSAYLCSECNHWHIGRPPK